MLPAAWLRNSSAGVGATTAQFSGSSFAGTFSGQTSRPSVEPYIAAGTETSSISGQRSAVSVPPKTQPVSRQIVPFSQSASGVGVWP